MIVLKLCISFCRLAHSKILTRY